MPETKAREQIRRSWKDVEPSLTLKRASTLSGISERELRRLIDEGSVFASQAKPNTKGSTLKLSRESLVDHLVGTIR